MQDSLSLTFFYSPYRYLSISFASITAGELTFIIFFPQVSIDEDLKDSREVSFQAALLYTSSRGERRIRVHTLCIPTSANLQEIIQVGTS